MEEFYDYLRFGASMASNNIPELVKNNIKEELSSRIRIFNSQELDEVDAFIDSYTSFYESSCRTSAEFIANLTELENGELIKRSFVNELAYISVNLEKMLMVRDFLGSIKELTQERKAELQGRGSR